MGFLKNTGKELIYVLPLVKTVCVYFCEYVCKWVVCCWQAGAVGLRGLVSRNLEAFLVLGISSAFSVERSLKKTSWNLQVSRDVTSASSAWWKWAVLEHSLCCRWENIIMLWNSDILLSITWRAFCSLAWLKECCGVCWWLLKRAVWGFCVCFPYN